MKKDIISITDSAADHIKELLKKDGKKPIGIGINVETGGCSGSKYKFEYIYQKKELDEEINDKGVRVFINPNAVLKVFWNKT